MVQLIVSGYIKGRFMGWNHMLEDELNRLFHFYLKKSYFSGAVCLISKGDEIIFKASYGNRIAKTMESNSNYSLSRTTKKMNTSTIFDLASITKMFITTIILHFISQGKLQLRTPLGECLLDIREKSNLMDHIGHVTMEQLLTHSSGIPAWYPFYVEQDKKFYTILNSIVSPSSMVEDVTYSDINYMLLGEVIKKKSKLSLEECVNRVFIQSLEMKMLTFGPVFGNNVAATEFGNRIEQKMCAERGHQFNHWRSTDLPIIGEVNDGNCHYYFQGKSGHAGLFASAIDVLKLGHLYVKGGEYQGKSIINREIIQRSTTKLNHTRGLGWEFSDVFPNGCGHTGFTGTSLWVVPTKKMVVVILTNRLHVSKPISIQSFRKEVHQKIIKTI